MLACPRCGLQVTELSSLDAEMKAQLQAVGETAVPDQICRGCASDLKKTLSMAKGGVLMAQERAKEVHKFQLWNSRVQLIRKARGYMNQKLYNEAALSYEKYIRILEIFFGLKKGETIRPEHFRDNARTEEITVVASVYWDLFRIYDTFDAMHARQENVAQQLANFSRFTPIFPDIVRKAEVFQKTAKNPHAVKSFLKFSAASRPRCFVATAVFEDPLASEVQWLRLYRDVCLLPSRGGRWWIYIYYQFSPPLARIIDRNGGLKIFLRPILSLFAKRARRLCHRQFAVAFGTESLAKSPLFFNDQINGEENF